MSRPATVAWIACLVATAACEPGIDDQSEDRWSLGSTPSFLVGAVDGDSAYLFQRIRSAHFASEDRIVVADAGLKVIRVFDSDGQFLRQIGRGGEGPGEFIEVRETWMAGPDTIGVWDSGALRLSYFTVEGELIGTAPVHPPSDMPGSLDLLAGTLSDGSVIIGAIEAEMNQEPEGRPDQVHLARFDRAGNYLGVIGAVDGLVRAQQGRMFGPIPFSPFPYFAVVHDSLVFTNGSKPSVAVRDLGWQGREVRVPPRGVEADSAWKSLQSALEATGGWQLEQLSQVPHGDSIPHVAGLLVDDEGRIWTKRFDPGTDAVWHQGGQDVRGGSWWIVNPQDGIGEIKLPGTFKPLEVRRGRVLGVLEDSLGVQSVAVFELLGPGD